MPSAQQIDSYSSNFRVRFSFNAKFKHHTAELFMEGLSFMKILILAGVIPLVSIAVNLCRLASTKYYYKKFLKSDPRLEQYVYPVSQLFDKAGTNRCFASTRYAGEKISYCIAKYDFRSIVEDTFNQTIGVFRFRIRNSVNPFYWFQFPARLLNSAKIEFPRPVKVLVPILFWLVGVIAAYYVEKFLESDFFTDYLSVLCSSLK